MRPEPEVVFKRVISIKNAHCHLKMATALSSFCTQKHLIDLLKGIFSPISLKSLKRYKQCRNSVAYNLVFRSSETSVQQKKRRRC